MGGDTDNCWGNEAREAHARVAVISKLLFICCVFKIVCLLCTDYFQ